MRVFILEASQWVPRSRQEVFPFFADAFNLEQLTPRWLRFRVLAAAPPAMRQGLRIDYRLRLHGIPLSWQSEITVWDPPEAFVDRQVRGPYRLWEHEHRFDEKDGGTLLRDRVRYAVLGGALVERLFVRRDVRRIFGFRAARLTELFGARTQVLTVRREDA